jgi:hypothetical protein
MGTAAGMESLVYEICEQAELLNCTTATANVMVGAPTIDAVNDSGSVVTGTLGGTAVADVLANDTLDGGAATLANVGLSEESSTDPGVTLDVGTGEVNVAANTPAGVQTLEYEICDQLNITNCAVGSVEVTVGPWLPEVFSNGFEDFTLLRSSSPADTHAERAN